MTNNPRYTLGTEANRIFMASETYELLKFGKGFPAPNGGSGWLNADGTLDPSHGVETWITSRMAHVYSIGAMLGYLGAGELADAALKGLTGILHDDEHGGWYPQVFADGTHAPGKVCYAHAFVILAASSALLAGRPGAKELLDEALATYDKHFWNDEIGLAVDTWNTEFTELDPYRGLNANMHTTEAFLAVADATGDNAYRVRAGRIIDHVIGWAKHNEWRIPEHFKSDWSLDLECNVDKKDDQFKPYGATPGHGIEWARLITQWALSSFANLDGAQPYVDAAEHLFARAVADAWNADGTVGLAYTTDWNGKPVVTDRMHWTLAESLNTSATLYAATGEEMYANWYATFAQYVDEHVIDHESGSWFHQLDKNNHVIGTVWPGKSDLYHAFQSTLIPFLDPAVSIATAIFPKISKAIADRNIDEARKDLSSALRNLNLIMCFFAAAFIVLPLPIILALLPSISVREALLISAPLAALGIGLPLSSSYLVIQRTFYAFEDGKHPFIFMAITMAIQGGVIIASTFILPPTQWITVIGLAISVSFILPYPLLTHMLRSRFDGDVDDKRIITAYAKALVATIAACVIGLLCRNGVYRLVGAHIGPDDGTMNWGQAVLSAILLTIVIAIVYLACLWALRAEELTSVVGMLAARIPGLGNKPKSGGTASPNGKLEQSTAENGDQE